MEAIVAFSKNHIIGINGELPWHLPEDMRRFRQMTIDCVLIMGRRTFDSLGGQPLQGREHWVITRTPEAGVAMDNVRYMTMTEACTAAAEACSNGRRVMIVGGESIYEHFLMSGGVQRLYVSYVDRTVPVPEGAKAVVARFPVNALEGYELVNAEPSRDVGVQYLTYVLKGTEVAKRPEAAYLRLLEEVRQHGQERPDRTQTGTLSSFGHQMRFDISTHVPLLTTKFTAWKSCLKELLWFLRGDTNALDLRAQGVPIWDGNTTREFLDGRGLTDLPEGDIGAGYGFQWRHFGAEYKTCKEDYSGKGVDQLEALERGLREDPYGRRHILTAWNPTALSRMALPPCHIFCQFYVTCAPGQPMQLSCHMYQRSVDMFLGSPFNIMSYTALTYILAARLGMVPKELVISTGDTHVYLDHIAAVDLQLKRCMLPPPILRVSSEVATKRWEELSMEDFTLYGYVHHPVIKAKMSV